MKCHGSRLRESTEAKDAVVKLSLLTFIDFGDGAVPADSVFHQMTLRVSAEMEKMLHAIHQTKKL